MIVQLMAFSSFVRGLIRFGGTHTHGNNSEKKIGFVAFASTVYVSKASFACLADVHSGARIDLSHANAMRAFERGSERLRLHLAIVQLNKSIVPNLSIPTGSCRSRLCNSTTRIPKDDTISSFPWTRQRKHERTSGMIFKFIVN